jgi:hypothetical protein
MKYHVEVKVRLPRTGNQFQWQAVRPTGGQPYAFTKDEANNYIRRQTAESFDPENYRLVIIPERNNDD